MGNDLIFAKVKGYPAWPACVIDPHDKRGLLYKVYFYGTHETAIVKLEDMSQFDELSKTKFAKQKLGWLRKGFDEAIEEMENRPETGYKTFLPMIQTKSDVKLEDSEITDEPILDGSQGKSASKRKIKEEKLDLP